MKVFIADDSLPVRELLVELMSEYPEIEVVGQTSDALEATNLIRRANPDVVLLDMRLQRGNGLGVLGALKKDMPWVVVLVLSGQIDPAYRRMCMSMGAHDYFAKCEGFGNVIQTILRGFDHATFPPQPAGELSAASPIVS